MDSSGADLQGRIYAFAKALSVLHIEFVFL